MNMNNIYVLFILNLLILISCVSKIKNEKCHSFKENFFSGIDTILNNSGISVDTNTAIKFFVDTSINIKLYPEFDKVTLNRYFHKIDWDSYLIFKKPDTNFLFVIVDSLTPRNPVIAPSSTGLAILYPAPVTILIPPLPAHCPANPPT